MRNGEGAYLRAFLAPLAPWLDRPDVTDILINRPGEVWFEAAGQPLAQVAAPEITDTMLQRLAQQIAAVSAQGVNREHPLLAASLPNGARVQSGVRKLALGLARRGEAAGGTSTGAMPGCFNNSANCSVVFFTCEPTTITTSHSCDSRLTASWRFCVA